MANILDRFGTIIKSNINALLDKAEDPGKMIDQYITLEGLFTIVLKTHVMDGKYTFPWDQEA